MGSRGSLCRCGPHHRLPFLLLLLLGLLQPSLPSSHRLRGTEGAPSSSRTSDSVDSSDASFIELADPFEAYKSAALRRVAAGLEGLDEGTPSAAAPPARPHRLHRRTPGRHGRDLLQFSKGRGRGAGRHFGSKSAPAEMPHPGTTQQGCDVNVLSIAKQGGAGGLSWAKTLYHVGWFTGLENVEMCGRGNRGSLGGGTDGEIDSTMSPDGLGGGAPDPICRKKGNLQGRITLPTNLPIKDVNRHYLSCMDSRSAYAVQGSPGGDLAEFIIVLDAIEKIIEGQETIQQRDRTKRGMGVARDKGTLTVNGVRSKFGFNMGSETLGADQVIASNGKLSNSGPVDQFTHTPDDVSYLLRRFLMEMGEGRNAGGAQQRPDQGLGEQNQKGVNQKGHYMHPYGKPYFYMHTDVDTKDKWFAAARVPEPWNPLDDKGRRRILQQSAKPEHVGCTHLKYMIQEAAKYKIRAKLVESAIQAFMAIFFDPFDPLRQHLLFPVLNGAKQKPAAVINVESPEGCHPLTPLVVPRIHTVHPDGAGSILTTPSEGGIAAGGEGDAKLLRRRRRRLLDDGVGDDLSKFLPAAATDEEGAGGRENEAGRGDGERARRKAEADEDGERVDGETAQIELGSSSRADAGEKSERGRDGKVGKAGRRRISRFQFEPEPSEALRERMRRFLPAAPAAAAGFDSEEGPGQGVEQRRARRAAGVGVVGAGAAAVGVGARRRVLLAEELNAQQAGVGVGASVGARVGAGAEASSTGKLSIDAAKVTRGWSMQSALKMKMAGGGGHGGHDHGGHGHHHGHHDHHSMAAKSAGDAWAGERQHQSQPRDEAKEGGKGEEGFEFLEDDDAILLETEERRKGRDPGLGRWTGKVRFDCRNRRVLCGGHCWYWLISLSLAFSPQTSDLLPLTSTPPSHHTTRLSSRTSPHTRHMYIYAQRLDVFNNIVKTTPSEPEASDPAYGTEVLVNHWVAAALFRRSLVQYFAPMYGISPLQLVAKANRHANIHFKNTAAKDAPGKPHYVASFMR